MENNYIREAAERAMRELKYNGLEIFMMNVGNADCFLVIQYQTGGNKDVYLIDGGKKSDAETIIGRIKGLGITHIDYVINTHPHDDHAGGLVDIIKDTTLTFGQVWMHASWTRIDVDAIRDLLGRNSAIKVLDKFENSLATQIDVFNTCVNRKIPVYEPFAGDTIGSFKILGPTPEFYASCLAEFNNLTSVKQWNDYLTNQASQNLMIHTEAAQADDKLEGTTSPENESSVIMTLEHNKQKFLFCGDAGCNAFRDISNRNQAGEIQNIHWMQAPHHGSSKNVWPELIEWMNPDTVYISCKGSAKHPSRKLVNHLKAKCSSNVYATYYPQKSDWTWIQFNKGTTPDRNTSVAAALYNA